LPEQDGPGRRCNSEVLEPAEAGREPAKMDMIVMILFASLMTTTSALTFMEVRRIRKKLNVK
jgi:hypothetical protein